MSQPLEDIQFVLLEVRTERDFFERRVGLIVGAIEKIGMIGFAYGLLAAWNAYRIVYGNDPSDPPSWAVSLAFAILILYSLGWAAHFLMMRLDRILKLLELAVERKKSELARSPTAKS